MLFVIFINLAKSKYHYSASVNRRLLYLILQPGYYRRLFGRFNRAYRTGRDIWAFELYNKRNKSPTSIKAMINQNSKLLSKNGYENSILKLKRQYTPTRGMWLPELISESNLFQRDQSKKVSEVDNESGFPGVHKEISLWKRFRQEKLERIGFFDPPIPDTKPIKVIGPSKSLLDFMQPA